MRSLPHALVLIIAGFLLFFNLGANSLHTWDEAGHAIVAREMSENGDVLTLRYYGEPYFKKSPLKFWLTALTFKLFGVNEWTVRLWSALFAFGTVAALCTLGDLAFGRYVGALAGLILITCHQYLYLHCARTGELDSALIFFWTLAMLLLVVAIDRESRKLLYLSFVAIGLCGLVKHSLIPVQLLMLVAIFLLLTGIWRRFPARAWAIALGSCIAVALPWTLLQTALHGSRFLEVHYGGEVGDRAASGLSTSSGPAIGFGEAFKTVKNGLFPWSLLVLFALPGALGGERDQRWKRVLLLVWVVVAALVVALGGEFRPRYILPAYPALALLVGLLVNGALKDQNERWRFAAILATVFIALLATTNATTLNVFKQLRQWRLLSVQLFSRLDPLPEDSTAWLWLIILVIVVITAWQFRSSLTARGLAVAAIATIALFQVVAPLRFSTYKRPVHRLILKTKQFQDEGVAVWTALPPRLSGTLVNHFYLLQLEPQVSHHGLNPRAIMERVESGSQPVVLVCTPGMNQAISPLVANPNAPDAETLLEAAGFALLKLTPK